MSFSWPITDTTGNSPDVLPDVMPEDRLAVDVETNGLDVYGDSMPVGISVADSEREFYFPFGHAEGRQHNPTVVRYWAQEMLAGKEIIFRNAKFDLEMLRKWGLNLEALGCQPREVQHAAALLDDRRRKFDLESLAKDRLGQGKLPQLTELWRQPAHMVTLYARRDARLTYDLDKSYAEPIKAENLERVLNLENSLVYATLSMEREGAWLDIPKLERWIKEVEGARIERLLEIHRCTGLQINPDSGHDMAKLFNHLGLVSKAGFDESVLKSCSSVEVKLALEARQLGSLLSKYLIKYRDAAPNGLLRYQLHQLRADEGGTITGRYASSKVNIQQVMKPDKQAPVTKPWIIRELFVPAPGAYKWLSADASQIEFRLMCHYANAERLIQAYKTDANTDFHQLVTDVVLHNCMPRVLAKNVNFCKVYGGGARKVALMTGKSLEEAEEMVGTYDRLFPEAKRLLNRATRTAEQRGYVKTYIGRRRRYLPGDRYYSALNSVLQGTAADLMKMAIKVLYDERRTTGYMQRLTCHDETDGDSLNDKTLGLVNELINEQRLALRVPITWQSGEGANWKEAAA